MFIRKLNSSPFASAIASDARTLGIRSGDTLLIHSSLKSLGEPGISPADVINGLLEAVGPEGTLLFPTLSYLSCNARNPFFDVRTTPCCVGAIPEYFRQLPGVSRSLCPTHSCAAIGSKAQWLVDSHQLDHTPCGPHSPYARLRQIGGRVLFLGCGCGCNTSMHAVEELTEPPYLFGDIITYTITDSAGSILHSKCRAHNFAGVRQCYDRVPKWMSTGVAEARIRNAPCILLDVIPMWDTALAALQKDPFALVEPR